MSSPRRSVEASWEYLNSEGYDIPVDAQGSPFVPDHVPQHDDEELGLSFFKAGLEGKKLEDLTIPRTYFGRSEINHVSFRNTDLSESNLCWNGWNDCDFSDTDLRGADIRASHFIRCRFVRSILTEADLRHSSFEDCQFTDA
ncbi:MAG: pentapeptide repeat-containing protein [Phycisphaerae bacterium]